MTQRAKAEDKWAQTGWRIEQKYANKVLLGNWAEERLQFTRKPKIAYSTSCVDYRPHWDFKPDISERRSALLRAEGLPSKMIFGQCDPPSSHYLVTQYEESYGHNHTNAVPTLQYRHTDNLIKKHRRSDQMTSVPCQLLQEALPNNFGPLQPANHHFEIQQSHLPSLTEYRSAYQRHPLSAFCQSRFAKASRMLSSHLYGASHNNKDLDLRQHLILQVPDHCLSVCPPSQQA
ncbi:cilia- and flagella-associated protein 107 [Archocentrus centrarchus]|uniref:cilia- and flagella-associated protein 107 n=1 Tax=Archocentrus centrarchus TaxID=63155 RepID=UPI0011EA1481|nr:uncharacterized protein C1orf158 homolog [Archocentrus centrarchus]